jgi:hypothetical protein
MPVMTCVSTSVEARKYTEYTLDGLKSQVKYWCIKVFENTQMVGFDITYAEPNDAQLRKSIFKVLEENKITPMKDYA